MKKRGEYWRLPGRGRKRGGTALIVRTMATLWLGGDHLLCRYGMGYVEELRRFYYRDIQAIAATLTNRRAVWNGIFIACFVLTGVLSAVSYLQGGGWTIAFFSAWACLFLVFAFINQLKGPTCKCQLRTAVSVEDLPSLKRTKVAERAIALIRVRLERAQGRLTREELEGHAHERRPSPSAKAVLHEADGRASDYDGRYHALLFFLLLLGAVIYATDMFYETLLVTLLAGASSASITVATVAALARQRGSAVTEELKGITWSAMAFVFVTYLLGYSLLISAAIQNPGSMGQQCVSLKTLSTISPFDNLFFMFSYIFCIVSFLVIGLLGLASMRRFRIERGRSLVAGHPAG
jgi:hypothetical protein